MTKKSNFEDYEPLGDEWKKEMLKWRKRDLLDFLTDQMIKPRNEEIKRLKSELQRIRETPEATCATN